MSLDINKFFKISHLAALAVFFCGAVSTVHGTSEEGDPDPRAGRQASMDFSHLDEPTSANTIRYAPVPSVSTRGPIAPAMQQPQGALSGKIVYTSPGHGWQYKSNLARWACDRGTNNGIVEDLGNLDQFNYYVEYLFNAGATVVPFRPVGNQTNEVIVDNSSAGMILSGTWTAATGGTFFGNASDAVGFQFASATNGTDPSKLAEATYTPNIPQRGFYPVYAWALNGNNRSVDQLYRVNHTGGSSEVRVNHSRVGRGWVYLGTYYFEAGTAGSVQISNQSNASPVSGVVIADAIRFGNGMGDVLDGGVTSKFPREDEGCMYWIRRMAGVNGDSATYSNNVNAPPRMAAHMNGEANGAKTERVYIGIHSNAGGGRGACGLYNRDASARTDFQQALAETLGAEMNNDMRAMNSKLPTSWSTRTSNVFFHPDYNFGELNKSSINNEMDATIIETAFHDSAADAQIMRDADSRKYIARSLLHGTVKYFQQRGTGPAAFLPDEPKNIKVVSNGNGTVTVSWSAPAADPTGVQAPSSYVIYRSDNGYGFGSAITTVGTQATITVPNNAVTYFRVAARNAGGESFPTETVAVRPSTTGGKVLIVNGFDRMQESLNVIENRSSLGNHHRIKPWKMNNYDYVVPHAKALHGAGYGFDSTSNEALTAQLLTNYGVLVWAAGEESTTDNTFSAAEQVLVQNFLNLGKGIFVSGSEIGWDLQQAGNGQTFYNNYLLTSYASDESGVYAVSAGTGLLTGVGALSFAPASNIHDTSYPPLNGGFYPAEYADVINPLNGSAVVMSYNTTASPRGAAVAGSRNGYRVVSFAFPFENIINENTRKVIMDKSIPYLMPANASVSDWSVY